MATATSACRLSQQHTCELCVRTIRRTHPHSRRRQGHRWQLRTLTLSQRGMAARLGLASQGGQMGSQSQGKEVMGMLETKKEVAHSGGVRNVVKPAPTLIPLCVSMTCVFVHSSWWVHQVQLLLHADCYLGSWEALGDLLLPDLTMKMTTYSHQTSHVSHIHYVTKNTCISLTNKIHKISTTLDIFGSGYTQQRDYHKIAI